MFKRSITFNDLDGNSLTEDFYFHMTEAEWAKLSMRFGENGLEGYMSKLVQDNDIPALIEFFDNFILGAYGVRSEDGRRFIKTKEHSLEFSQTEAFSNLFMDIMSDAKKAIEFFKGCAPKNLGEKLEESMVKAAAELPSPIPAAGAEDTRPAWERENRPPSTAELQSMPPEEIQRAFALRFTKQS